MTCNTLSSVHCIACDFGLGLSVVHCLVTGFVHG